MWFSQKSREQYKAAKLEKLKNRVNTMNVQLVSYKDHMCLDAKSQPYVFRKVTVDSRVGEDNPKIFLVIDSTYSLNAKIKTNGMEVFYDEADKYYVEMIKKDYDRWITLRDSLPLFGIEIKETKQTTDVQSTSN